MAVDEVYFFRITSSRLASLWGLEDNWTRMRQLADEVAGLGDSGR